jgi:hypothetical protein
MAVKSIPLRSSHGAAGLHANDAAFLERFAAREGRHRVAQQRPMLSVAQHKAHREQLSSVRFVQPKYSHDTEINVTGIFRKWREYADRSHPDIPSFR